MIQLCKHLPLRRLVPCCTVQLPVFAVDIEQHLPPSLSDRPITADSTCAKSEVQLCQSSHFKQTKMECTEVTPVRITTKGHCVDL